MAASVSTIGYGGTLEWSTDAGATWTAVSEFKSGSIPSNSMEKVDRTHMGSPDRSRESTPGLRDPQDVTFTFNFNSTDFGNLSTLEAAATVASWRHTLATEDATTTGAIYEYPGFVSVGGGETTVEGITEVTATIHLTRTYTFAPAS